MGHKYMLNRSEKGQFCFEFRAPFCENKYICLQGWIEGEHLWDFEIYNCCFSGKDHAGIDLNIEVFGYRFNFEFCDLRHWNETEQRFYIYDEPQPEWIRPDYPMEQYFREIKEFISDHPEIDRNYYRRCLITYKLCQQNALYGDDWNKRLRADKIGEIARSKAPKLKNDEISESGNMNIFKLFSIFDKEMKFRGWQAVTESENSGYSADFSSEKEIIACIYDRYNSGRRYSFSLWNIGDRYRARIIRNGGMIILPYENLTHKDESRMIGKIIAYLRQRIAPINKSLCHKNMIIEILRRRNEIKCFSLGHYFSGVYISKERGTEYSSGSLCIEIFNSARMTLYRIAEDFCAAMDKPEILLKDCRDGKIRRFER